MGDREHSEFEDIIGPFVNVLVLRISLGGNPSFAQLLARVRDVVLDAHAHRSTPFEAVIERLRAATFIRLFPALSSCCRSA